MTQGIKNALSRGSVHSLCTDCGFPLPRYPGRYPKTCPSCGVDKPTATAEEELTLAPGEVPDVGDTLTIGERTATVVEVDDDAAYLEWEDGEVQALSR
jgi:hypothetical protein